MGKEEYKKGGKQALLPSPSVTVCCVPFDRPGKKNKEPQMRDGFYQVGLWTCLGNFFLIDV